MTQQIINTGVADKGNGDPIRTAFTKVNANFTELFNQVSAGVVVDTTPPETPGEGDLWWDPESGRMYVSYGANWVDASPVDGVGTGNTIAVYDELNEVTTDVSVLRFEGAGVSVVNQGSDVRVTIDGTSGGLSISDFGLGFTNTLDAGKITTSKLYNENLNPGLNNLYVLEVTNGGVVVLPDQSIINGATLKTVAGNYAGITAGPASPAGKDEDSWVWVDNDGATIATKYSTDNYQWKFGNDGSIEFPDSTVQTTAYTGSVSSLVNGSKTVSLDGSLGNLTFTNGEQIKTNFLDGGIELYQSSDNTIGIYSDGAEIKTFATGGEKYTWTFGTDGSLTAPGTISAKTTFTLETTDLDTVYETYQELIIQLTDAFTVENYTGQGYPASKDSYAAIVRAKALNPLIPDSWIPLSNSLRNAYFTWAASSITLTVDGGGFVIANGGGVSWRFEEATGLRFPDNTYQNTAFVGSALSLKSTDGSQTVTLGNDGTLTLPDDSVIASYKPVTVIAATTTTQTISDSASAAFIQFVDTVDTASAFSTGTFTVPYTGYYQVNLSVYFSSAVALTSTSFLLIDTNLDFTKQVRIFDGNWSGSYLHYSTVISAAAGDAVRIAIRQVSGGDVDIISGSRLTIHRVSIS
jgi:hypothetical protein